MQPEIYKYLYDVNSACKALTEFTRNKTLDDYQSDTLLRSGVERQFEIIGEALNQALKMDPDLAEAITNVRQIINLRNIIIHSYSAIENETIWGILNSDLPILYQKVKEILGQTNSQ